MNRVEITGKVTSKVGGVAGKFMEIYIMENPELSSKLVLFGLKALEGQEIVGKEIYVTGKLTDANNNEIGVKVHDASLSLDKKGG